MSRKLFLLNENGEKQLDVFDFEHSKYILDWNDSVKEGNYTLYRVVYTDGYKGGYIEDYSNLSQDGLCEISDGVKVFNGSKVLGNAKVSGNVKLDCCEVSGDAEIEPLSNNEKLAIAIKYSEIKDSAKITFDDNDNYIRELLLSDKANLLICNGFIETVEIRESAYVCIDRSSMDNCCFEDNSQFTVERMEDIHNVYLEGSAEVSIIDGVLKGDPGIEIRDNAQVSGFVEIVGGVVIEGRAEVRDYATLDGFEVKISDWARVIDNGKVLDRASVSGKVVVGKDAVVRGMCEIDDDSYLEDIELS